MNSEFAQLLDLVLSHGIKHSDIISNINEAVTDAFKKRYPDEKSAFSIIVDEKNGTVRLISGNTDITPSEFSPLAGNIAYQTLIQMLKNGKVISQNNEEKSLGSLITSWITGLFFWGYNSFYLILFSFFIIGLLSTEFRNSVIEYVSTLGFIHQILTFILITGPLFITLYALREQISKRRVNLARLFFIFEVPLVFLILILLSVFHNAIIPIQIFSLLSVFIPFIVYLNFSGYKPTLFREKAAYLAIVIPVFIGLLYLTFLFSFFLPIIVGSVAKSFLGGIFYDFGMGFSRGFSQYFSVYSIISTFLAAPFFLVFLSIFIFFLILPYQLVYIFAKLIIFLRNQLITVWTKTKTDLFCLIYSAILILLFVLFSYQPDASPLIANLSKFTSASTFEDKEVIAKSLISKENILRQVLLDMYDARNRYPFTLDDEILAKSYRETFNFDYTLSGFIQTSFNLFAYPLTYQGSTKNSTQAVTNYQYLFGYSIYDSGRNTPETKEVMLLNKKVSINQDYAGLFANVTIEEEYENKSTRNQEIIYEFSLPTDAVITDLKLGPDLEFNGVISPKGAAQTVYQQEVNRSRDPALLEQTGPRQYRLRIFPIPGKNDFTTLNGKNQKVQYSYVVGVAPEGFPLPVYSKIFNLNSSSAKLTYLLNNEIVTAERDAHFLKNPTTGSAPVDLCNYQYDIIPKTSYTNIKTFVIPHLQKEYLKNNSVCNRLTGLWFPKLLRNYKIAILLDVSYENRESTVPEELRKLLKSDNRLVDSNKIDLYHFNDKISESRTISSNLLSKPFDIVYFGTSDLKKTLSSFNDSYDFAVIATGKMTSSQVNSDFSDSPRFPIYLMHNDGEIPPYGNKLTEYIFKSRGKVTDSFQEAFNHFVLSKQLQSLDKTLAYIDIEPYWSIGIKINKDSFPPDTFPADVYYGVAEKELFSGNNLITFKDFPINSDDPLSYIVGSKYLTDTISRQKSIISGNLSFLDELNIFAKRGNFVTPYSSLIALVNDQQKANLNNQEQLANRYEDNSLNNRPINNPLIGNIIPPTNISGGVDFSISKPKFGQITSPNPLFGSFLGFNTSSLRIPSNFEGGSESRSSGFFTTVSSLLALFIPINLLIIFVSLLAFFVSLFFKSLTKFRKKRSP